MHLSSFFDQFYAGSVVLPLYIYFLARLKYKGVENLELMLEKCETEEEGEMFVYNNVDLNCNFINFADQYHKFLWFSCASNEWEMFHLGLTIMELDAMKTYFENSLACKNFVTVDHCPSEEQKKLWSQCIYTIYKMRKARLDRQRRYPSHM